jgi:hypothetical protein
LPTTPLTPFSRSSFSVSAPSPLQPAEGGPELPPARGSSSNMSHHDHPSYLSCFYPPPPFFICLLPPFSMVANLLSFLFRSWPESPSQGLPPPPSPRPPPPPRSPSPWQEARSPDG